jgi:predicted Zn-dependent protease
MAAILLGALAVSRNPQAGGAIISGTSALAAQQQLNFSRDMEREADRIGLGVMEAAGFEPQGFVTMFEKLQQAHRLNDTGAFPYLRTHPMNTERAADIQSRQQLSGRGPAQATIEHSLASGRARVFANPGVDTLRGMLTEVDSSSFAAQPKARQAGALYAAAFAAARLREPANVTRMLARLDTAVAGDAAGQRLARLLAAEIALGQGDAARALKLVDMESRRRPDVLIGSQAQIRLGQAGDVAQRLQTWVANQPRDAAAWQLLAAAYTAQGQGVRAVRAEAESRVAQLDYTAALDRFKAAQDMVRRGAGDHIEASIIDTRARQVESLLREQALER